MTLVGTNNHQNTALVCPACSKPNPAQAKFCQYCGTAITVTQACNNCGKVSPKQGAKFCGTCGTQLPLSTNTNRQPLPAPAPTVPQEKGQLLIRFSRFADIMGMGQELRIGWTLAVASFADGTVYYASVLKGGYPISVPHAFIAELPAGNYIIQLMGTVEQRYITVLPKHSSPFSYVRYPDEDQTVMEW